MTVFCVCNKQKMSFPWWTLIVPHWCWGFQDCIVKSTRDQQQHIDNESSEASVTWKWSWVFKNWPTRDHPLRIFLCSKQRFSILNSLSTLPYKQWVVWSIDNLKVKFDVGFSELHSQTHKGSPASYICATQAKILNLELFVNHSILKMSRLKHRQFESEVRCWGFQDCILRPIRAYPLHIFLCPRERFPIKNCLSTIAYWQWVIWSIESDYFLLNMGKCFWISLLILGRK